MSGLKVSSYRDLEAERRRAEARDRARIARRLKVLQRLERELAKLNNVPPTSSEAIASRLSDRDTPFQPSEREICNNRLEHHIAQIEHALSEAIADRHRVALTARTLLGQAEGDIRQDLEHTIKSAAKADRDAFARMKAGVEAMVTQRVMNVEAPRQASAPSAEADALARALMSPEGKQTSPSPLPAQALSAPLSGLIEALTKLGPDGEFLRARAHELVAAPSIRDFQLKLDSLCMDAAAIWKAQIEVTEVETRVNQALDALTPFDDPESQALRAKLTASGTLPNPERIELAHAAEQHAAEQASREDGEKARRALLEGLADLGYEVSVQESDWNTGQRITARRPNEPNYDVQLAARGDGKVQAKVRAYRHSGRSDAANARDIEFEEAWCADFKQLHDRLKDKNLDAFLERDEAPGSAAPLLIDGTDEYKARTRQTPRKLTGD